MLLRSSKGEIWGWIKENIDEKIALNLLTQESTSILDGFRMNKTHHKF